MIYDETNQEIIIADHPQKNRCVVFTEDGKFLRQFYFPVNSWIRDLNDFDDQTLLAYNNVRESGLSDGNINQITPYVFLSKSDGSIVSRVNLSFPKRVSDTHVTYRASDGMRTITVNTPYKRIKYGQEFIIADRSSDTVFLLTQDKKVTPLFAKTPSSFDENQFITMFSVHFKLNNYLFFMTNTYNLPEVIKLNEKGQYIGSAVKMSYFVYDMHSSEVFVPIGKAPLGTNIDAPENTFVTHYPADILAGLLKKGRLDGKLKQVAQTINEEDNPVVEIIKYRLND